MRLEAPAPGHHTVMQGENWQELAMSWLGASDMARNELLAHANKGVPWVPPVEGQEIEIPAVVTYIAGEGETVNTCAARFWGNPNRGWELNSYNGRQGVNLRRGEVVLVPMPGLRLTEAGRAEARRAERDGASGAHGPRAATQGRRRTAAAPGRRTVWPVSAEAVARGNRVLGGGALTHPQLAIVYRALLEAYVALDARGPATAACAAWRSNDPGASLDLGSACRRRSAPRATRRRLRPCPGCRRSRCSAPDELWARNSRSSASSARAACRSSTTARRIAENDRVALKVIHQELAGDPQIRGRFTREASILRRLEGDHLCPVLDFGEVPDPRRPDAGMLYMARPRVDGPALDALIKKSGPLSLLRVVAVVLDVCEALREAHLRRGSSTATSSRATFSCARAIARSSWTSGWPRS